VTEREQAVPDVVPVMSRGQLDDFIRCPQALARDDTPWIAPLAVVQRAVFAPDPN